MTQYNKKNQCNQFIVKMSAYAFFRSASMFVQHVVTQGFRNLDYIIWIPESSRRTLEGQFKSSGLHPTPALMMNDKQDEE
jgi:hypothetical protein